MMDLSQIARIVALFGLVLLLLAGVLFVLDRLDLPLGNLPGDIRVERGKFTCVVPILSSLIISIILTVILNLVIYFMKK